MSPVVARLEKFIERIPESGCWFWIGATNEYGYGRFNYKGKNRFAHRVSYEVQKGAIPNGLALDHLCRNRCCVNPAHLEPVTWAENVRRGDTFAMGAHERNKTHCINGHEYTPENTIRKTTIRDGKVKHSRSCRICHNLRRRKP